MGRRGLGWLVAAAGLTAGCVAPPPQPPTPLPRQATAEAGRADPNGVRFAEARNGPAEATPDPPRPGGAPLAGLAELTAPILVRATLDRNPTVEQMAAAAAAAAARVPQVASLDDPTLTFWTAPFSAGSPNADYAARVEVSQKFLTSGKRGLKGRAALAEASAAGRDVDDVRLQLAEAAAAALADYYAAVKALDVGRESLRLLGEFRRNAEARYRTGQAPQQDILQADVELARQEERLVIARRARQVAVARINTLLHLPPDSPLPPPAEPTPGGPLPDSAALRAAAVAARPDVRALADRVAADEAALALAQREYNPDVEVMAAYDGFWQGPNGRPLQWQVGARVNLPVRTARRGGAVAEAQARLAQRRAELARLVDQVQLQVQEAYEQVRESEDVVALYGSKALPAAAANVTEAQAAYTAGRVPFLNLVAAQRATVELRERYYTAVAAAARRRAALERSVGGMP